MECSPVGLKELSMILCTQNVRKLSCFRFSERSIILVAVDPISKVDTGVGGRSLVDILKISEDSRGRGL